MTTTLTAGEVAQRLRCAEWTVRSMARQGKIRGSFVAGRWLFTEAAIEELLENTSNQTEPTRRRRRRAS